MSDERLRALRLRAEVAALKAAVAALITVLSGDQRAAVCKNIGDCGTPSNQGNTTHPVSDQEEVTLHLQKTLKELLG